MLNLFLSYLGFVKHAILPKHVDSMVYGMLSTPLKQLPPIIFW